VVGASRDDGRPPVGAAASQMYLSTYLAESAFYVFYQAGLLEFLVKSTDVPAGSPLKLVTNTFYAFAPGIAKQYPNLPVNIGAVVGAMPTVSAVPGALSVTVPLTLHIMPIQAGGVPADAFDVLALTSAAINVRVTGARNETIQAQLVYLNASMSLVNSTVGPVNVLIMTGVLDLILPFVVDAINALLPAFPLPSIAGLSFVNTDLEVDQDCIRFNTDASYTPPEEVLAALPYLRR
jgi:hypothetical protein